MNASLFDVALLIFFTAILVDIIFGTSNKTVQGIPYALGAAGSAFLVALGIHIFATSPVTITFGSLFEMGTTTLYIDDWAALFLVLLFGIGTLVSVFSVSWVHRASSPRRRGLAAAYILLLGSVAVILCAADAFTFIFAWESLALSFYVLTGIARQSRKQAEDSWLTLGVQKIGGASILIGFLMLAGKSGSLLIANWHATQTGTVHDVAYALIVIGFGAKLGIVPLQAWMPVGYSAASGPSRTAMAGIAANVAVYGLFRFFEILGKPPVWLVVGVLFLGGLTALLGITFASVEGRLSKMVAYSSVENAGIIFTAFGVALAGASTNDIPLVAIGLLAATMHTIAHAIAKSTMFTSLVNIEAAVGSDELENLRGVGRSLPYSGLAFSAGAVTLAGLPPTIGFVSEWLVLEALMQEFRISGLAIRLALALAGALIALTSGLAAFAFLRVLGLVLLGNPAKVSGRPERGAISKTTILFLGASCFALSAFTPLEIRFVANGLSSIVPKSLVEHSLRSAWVIQPVFANFSILSPSWLFVVMPSLFAAVLVTALIVSRGRYFRARKVPPWRSATVSQDGPTSYSTSGFSNLLRHVLANVLGTIREQHVLEPSKPESDREATPILRYETRVTEPIEAFIYRPIASAIFVVVRAAKRLQSGHLQAYVGYMLIALLVTLALVAGLR